jgi:hypothetical protein
MYSFSRYVLRNLGLVIYIFFFTFAACLRPEVVGEYVTRGKGLQGLRGSRDKLFPLLYPWGGLFLILGMMDGNCLGNKPKPEIWMLDSGNILPGAI